jgi:hypothetical protein
VESSDRPTPEELAKQATCLVCGNTATIAGVLIAPGVVTWPTPHCSHCAGFPQMAMNGNHAA